MTQALSWSEVPPLRSKELTRICSNEFVLIGSSEDMRFWWDQADDTYYREHICNSPSWWYVGTLP